MEREQWGSRVGFILAAVGSAIGLGNIWRFPYMAYDNGGGAFFVPYLIAMVTAGIPFMIMEFGLGHKLRGSSPTVFNKINKHFQFIGWFQVFIAAVISVYYIAVIGWAISYFVLSFTQAWGSDTSAYFFGTYLGLGDHNSPSNLGSIQPKIAGAVAFAWAITFYTSYTGIKGGIERISKIMMPVLFLLILVLIAFVVTLPGAKEGLNFLFKPNFSTLWQPKVWSAAYGQIFFTLSIGFAIMFAYSSYLPKKSDITNNALMTVLINCGFSILAGILIFSILGYMAHEQNVAVTAVVKGGVGLAFVTLPAAINLLPIPYVLGPLLFLSLTIAGVSSHISIIEAVTTALMKKLFWTRQKTAIVVCGLGLVVSMAFATNGGLLLLDVVDFFMNNVALLGSCLIELLIVGWIVKAARVRYYVNQLSEVKIASWFDYCIKFVGPVMLVWVLGVNIIKSINDPVRASIVNAINVFDGWIGSVTGVHLSMDAISKNYGGYSNSEILIYGWGLIAVMLIVSLLIQFTNVDTDPHRNINLLMKDE